MKYENQMLLEIPSKSIMKALHVRLWLASLPNWIRHLMNLEILKPLFLKQ